MVCKRQKENAAQWEGAWLRGFARIVAAVDGGISLASFDGEGEERRGGRADKRDWHQEMMMMMGGKGRKAEQKTANELTCGAAEPRPEPQKWHGGLAKVDPISRFGVPKEYFTNPS